MVELLTYVGVLVAGAVFGFEVRPHYERWRAKQAAEKAKAESSAKRSASAKEAAVKRKVRAGAAMAAGMQMNGSGNAQSKDAS